MPGVFISASADLLTICGDHSMAVNVDLSHRHLAAINNGLQSTTNSLGRDSSTILEQRWQYSGRQFS
jgi:hypothetical protein